MRVGFLFNHDQVHQVAHALPIALALRREAPDIEVIVATGNPRLTAEVRRLAASSDPHLPIVELGIRRPLTRFTARHLEALAPVTKLGVLRDNLDFFRGLDALVVTEKTSLLLRERFGLDRLKIIHTRHGAGDRAIGFDGKSAGFDHVLVSGAKVRDRLVREAGVPAARISVVGYPKFDLAGAACPRLPFADDGRPTVLYNPHVSPHLSSWFRHGRAVLDHFVRDRSRNLIFAPHCMLFHRSFVLTIDRLRVDRPGEIDRRALEAPNIHIDLGSPACTDMSYTNAADLYIGDVSSQVYEFMVRPRPCLFLDSHRTAWRDNANYAHWAAGEVIGDTAGLGAALDRATAQFASYLPAQRALVARSFDLTDEPSSSRAARAVCDVVRNDAAPVLRIRGKPDVAAMRARAAAA